MTCERRHHLAMCCWHQLCCVDNEFIHEHVQTLRNTTQASHVLQHTFTMHTVLQPCQRQTAAPIKHHNLSQGNPIGLQQSSLLLHVLRTHAQMLYYNSLAIIHAHVEIALTQPGIRHATHLATCGTQPSRWQQAAAYPAPIMPVRDQGCKAGFDLLPKNLCMPYTMHRVATSDIVQHAEVASALT
jgi:hypothetical protein